MPPAVVAGGIAAVGTIGGALIGSKSQSKANSQAAESNQAATNAQLQLGQQSLAQQNALAQQSIALGKDIYNSNYGILSPYASRGNVAGDAMNALLGLPQAPAMASPLALPNGQTYSAQQPAQGGAAPGGAPAPQQTMDQWATGALNSLLPNITQPDNIAAINAAPTPQAKLQAALAISPSHSDQYAGYAAYIAQNPQPVAAPPAPQSAPQAAPQPAPAAPAPQAATTQPVGAPVPVNAASTSAAAPGAYPRLSAFVNGGDFDRTGYMAARAANDTRIGFDPRGSNGWPNQGGGAPAAQPPAAPPAAGPAPGAPAPGTPAAGAPAQPAATAQTAQSAMENFANSAGMQFQLEQGADMINNRYAGAGALQSGAAMKAIQDYGQQTALNNYFMPYMGLLGNQQAVGAGAASSVAGVGQNFANNAAGINSGLANSTSAINAGMGGAIANGANNAGNLALANGQNQANMWNSIGGALGGFASSF